MRPLRSSVLVAAAIAAATGVLLAQGPRQFHIPPHPRPELFGTFLIQRGTLNGAAKPVVFSHWSHRLRYTCRVCHLELDFAMKHNTTEITEEANRKGAFCGACHDGKIAFGQTEPNCSKCHTGDTSASVGGFSKLDRLPLAMYGNGVDWSAALASGRITPSSSLGRDFKPLELDTTLTLEAEWNFVPPAIFPHADHVRWLDCANCHPSPFNIKKKTTAHFSMQRNLAGEFCGVCHLRVAFPMDDCKRCHPKMKTRLRF